MVFILELFLKIVLENTLLHFLDLCFFQSLLMLATLLLELSLLFIVATWAHKVAIKVPMGAWCQVVMRLFNFSKTARLLILLIVKSGGSKITVRKYSLRFWNSRLTLLLPTDLLSWLWEKSFLLEWDCLTSLNSRFRSLVMSLSSLDWLVLCISKLCLLIN